MTEAAPKSRTLDQGFEAAFVRAARRVLERNNVPEDEIETEIARLRASKPSWDLPSIEALESELERRL